MSYYRLILIYTKLPRYATQPNLSYSLATKSVTLI